MQRRSRSRRLPEADVFKSIEDGGPDSTEYTPPTPSGQASPAQAIRAGKAERRVKEHSGHASWETFNQYVEEAGTFRTTLPKTSGSKRGLGYELLLLLAYSSTQSSVYLSAFRAGGNTTDTCSVALGKSKPSTACMAILAGLDGPVSRTPLENRPRPFYSTRQ